MDSSAIVWLFCLIAIFGFSINGLLKRTVLALETDLGTRSPLQWFIDYSNLFLKDLKKIIVVNHKINLCYTIIIHAVFFVINAKFGRFTQRRDSEMSERSSSSSASNSSRSSRDDGHCSNSSSNGLLFRSSLTSNVPRIILMRNMPVIVQNSMCYHDESDYFEMSGGLLSDYKELPPPDYEEAQRLLINDEEQPPPSYTEYIEMLNSVTVTV